MMHLCLMSQATAELFPHDTVLIHIPTSHAQGAGFSTSSPTLDSVGLFAYSQTGGCEVVSLCGLNLRVPGSSWC